MYELLNIIETELGVGKLTNKGNKKYFCPFCHHRKRKLEIQLDVSKSHFSSWHCWTCDKAGHSIYSLFRQLNKPILLNKISTLENEINKKHKRTRKEYIPKEIDELTLPSEFISLSNTKKINKETQKVLQYLLNVRKLTIYDIFRYNIGYCLEGKYKNRIIIPNYNDKNELNFFIARYYGFNKYIISYDTPSVDKSEIIGFENLINFNLPVYLVEGVFDAITLKHNAIPLFGKIISKRLLTVLIKKQPPKVYIILDNDAIKKTIKNANYLFKKLILSEIYIVILNKNEDPNNIGFDKMTSYINNAILFNNESYIKLKMKYK